MDDDAGILGRINELAREEHELSSANLAGRRPTRTERLRHLQGTLDQCWDLLRQRRARRAAGLDPGEAQLRDAVTVEGYTG